MTTTTFMRYLAGIITLFTTPLAFAADPQDPGLLSFLPLVALFLIFYFVLIRPQQKKTKQHKTMTEGLQKGDDIITFGGVLGRIVDAEENLLKVEIAENVAITVQRSGVSALMPKGTYRAAFSSDE